MNWSPFKTLFSRCAKASSEKKKIVKKSALIPIATKFGTQEVDSFFQRMTLKSFDTQIFEIIFLEKMVCDAGRLFMVALVVKKYLNWQ